MQTSGLPKMTGLKKGASFKVLQINGEDGTKMPLHYGTKEAVVIGKEGFAQLKIVEIEHMLKEGITIIMQAHQNHTLSVKNKFKALGIMPHDSDIEFIE